MSRIITIGSQKGGSGKTTTAINLGYSLGRYLGRTLVIDLDPQGGLSLGSNLRNYTTRGVTDLLAGRHSKDEILAEAKDGSITVAGIGTINGNSVRHLETLAWAGRLAETLLSLSEGFDYTVIDSPAGMGGIVQAALRASDGVIIPADCQSLTLKSLPLYLDLIQQLAAEHSPRRDDLRLDGVLISRFDERSPTEREIRDQLFDIIPQEAFFRTVIPFHEIFASSSLLAAPAVLQHDHPEIARTYLDLALEVRQRENPQAATRETDEPARIF
jgi:chromosome partitioning protein